MPRNGISPGPPGGCGSSSTSTCRTLTPRWPFTPADSAFARAGGCSGGGGGIVERSLRHPSPASTRKQRGGPGADIVRDFHRHWTPVHLDVVVDNVRAAVVRARDAGARLESGIDSYAWGGLALMSDPFGHGF